MQISNNLSLAKNSSTQRSTSFGRVVDGPGRREMIDDYGLKRVKILDNLSDNIGCDILYTHKNEQPDGSGEDANDAYLVWKGHGVKTVEEAYKKKIPFINGFNIWTNDSGFKIFCPGVFRRAVNDLVILNAKKELSKQPDTIYPSEARDKWYNIPIHSIDYINKFFEQENEVDMSDLNTVSQQGIDRFVKKVVKNEQQIRKEVPQQEFKKDDHEGFAGALKDLAYWVTLKHFTVGEKYFKKKNPYEAGLLNDFYYDDKGKRIR